MANVPLPTMLQPAVVNERISRIKVKSTTLQNFLGFQSGGANTRKQESRRSSYDIFDQTRKLPTATLPGVEAATIARFPVGNVPFIIPRSAEKLPIPMEEICQFRPIGGPAGEIDVGGEQYIMDQETNVKQMYVNLREFQCAAMFRGSYSYTQSGDAFVHVFTGGSITIDYKVPAGNKTQLDMLGGGAIIGTSWADAAAPIVRDILAINQAFTELTGMGLTDIFINSTGWGNVVTNTEVRNLGGNVSNPVRSMVRDEEKNEFVAVLECLPWVTWHITDELLEVNGTNTRVIPNTGAIFLCDIDAQVATMMECPEPVIDPATNKMSMQYGEYFYHKFIDDPVSYEFHARFNALPRLQIPKAIAFGTVVF